MAVADNKEKWTGGNIIKKEILIADDKGGGVGEETLG